MKPAITVGERFGRLLVIELTTTQRPGQPKRKAAICLCDCGNQRTVLVQNMYRTDDPARSCGCTRRRGTMSEEFLRTRGDAERLTRWGHGLSRHPSYYRWSNMVDRCHNPAHAAYRNYGARGIHVHPQWHDPAVFIAYLDEVLGPRPDGPSLDRINNDAGYEPGNIRWATRSEQVRNRRSRS
jgi:hypothetical protein